MSTQLASRLPHSYPIGMRWEEDAETATWLEAGPIVEWDTGNTEKLTKHGLSTDDVESMLGGRLLFLGRITDPPHDEPRWIVLGRTATSRPVTVIFTRRGPRLRPISCRSMRRKERQRYEASEEGAPR